MRSLSQGQHLRREAPILTILRRLAQARSGERGQTALPVVLVLGAFALTGSVVGAAALESGTFGAEKVEETMNAAMRQVTGAVELRGAVIARTDGQRVTSILLDLGNIPGGDAVNLDPSAGSDTTTVTYIDDASVVNALPYSVTWIASDGDSLLEPGELAQIVIDTSAVDPPIGRDRRFMIEVRPPAGPYLALQRTIPPGNPLSPVVNLW